MNPGMNQQVTPKMTAVIDVSFHTYMKKNSNRMKNKILYLLIGILTIGVSSCNMNTDPYTSIPTEDAFKSVQDIDNAKNGVYSALGGSSFYGRNVIAVGDMSADLGLASSSSGHFVAVNTWAVNENTAELANIWSSGYTLIDRSVRGINGAKKLLSDNSNLSGNEKDIVNGAISQMYALRAFSTFMMTNLFGLPYKAGEANSQLGVVIVDTKPIEPFDDVQRSTVAECYDFILKDIANAHEYMTLLSAGAKSAISEFYMNEAAIYALEARVKLYMQDYVGAKAAAKKSLELRGAGEETFESYVSMWKSTAITNEDIFTISKSEADNLSANALNTLYGSYRATMTNFTKSLFGENDIRLGLFASNRPLKFAGTATAAAVSNIPVFRVSEMYLIVAEAEAADQSGTVAAAQEALLFSAKRNKDITTVADLPATKEELLTFIANERIRELFQEGHRYYDLRRTGAAATINNKPNFVLANTVFPIPADEINALGGVNESQQNPNWAANFPN